MISTSCNDWLRSTVGEYRIIRTLKINQRGEVYCIGCGKEKYILKLHNNNIYWRTEIQSYKYWVSAYEQYAPKLLHIYKNNDEYGILISWLPGQSAENVMELTKRKTYELFRTAGTLSKNLLNFGKFNHFGRIDDDGKFIDYQGQDIGQAIYNPVLYMEHQYISILTHVKNIEVLSSNDIRFAKALLTYLNKYNGEESYIVNTDFLPSNWLIDQKGKLTGVFDFEHIVFDCEVDAFIHLWLDYFNNIKGSEEAFFEGYGTNPIRSKPEQARLYFGLYALHDISFGVETNNQEFINHGIHVIRTLQKHEFP